MITLWITYKTWSHPLSQSEPSILMLHIPLRKWLHANPERVFSPRPARSAGRRPEGEGANLDRRLVPYLGKCKRIQSRIEFIYIYIYLYICAVHGPFCDGVRRLGTAKH